MSDVGSAVSFSPDGKRMVYRRIEDKNEDQILIANIDGTGEQVIFRRQVKASACVPIPVGPLQATSSRSASLAR